MTSKKMRLICLNPFRPEHFKKNWIPHEYFLAKMSKFIMQLHKKISAQRKMFILEPHLGKKGMP